MSNLLLLAQQVIPLSSGLGKLDEINVQLYELHALMHAQADEQREETPTAHQQQQQQQQHQPEVARSVRSGVHADLLARGLQLYPSDLPAAVAWAHRKQQELRASQESRQRQVDGARTAQIQSLLDLGFDQALCKRSDPTHASAAVDCSPATRGIHVLRSPFSDSFSSSLVACVLFLSFLCSSSFSALLLHNGDLSQSLSWLRDNGRNETEAIRRGHIQDVWGLEGVDFYQSIRRAQATAARAGQDRTRAR